METVLAQTCTDTGKTQLFLLFPIPPLLLFAAVLTKLARS